MYSYEEALEESLDYFDGSKMEATTFLKKYALKDLESGKYLEKSPDDMHRRLAKEFARIEQKYPNPMSEDKIYNYLKGFGKIIPNGSVMAGVGNNNQVMSYSNCFVVNNKADSYAGIMRTDEELVQLMKRRAGVGTDISHLRPRGSLVKNASETSTGAASFMSRFSQSTGEVAQEGRRGALMITIDIRHPDAEEFIDKKASDDTAVTNANVSVRIRDEFMRAILFDKDTYTQRWPIDADPEDAEYTKEVDPKRLWTKIVENAHESAEPGVIFWDRIRQESPADCYADQGFRTISTNPCQPGFSTLRTPNGLKTMEEISKGDEVWSEDGWVQVINKFETGTKSVYKYHTTAGSFYSTKDHRIKQHGEKIEIDKADVIDLLAGPNEEQSLNQQAVLDGLMVGDGSYHEASADPFYLNIGNKDQDYFDDPVSEFIKDEHAAQYGRAWHVDTTLEQNHLCELWNREVPEKYFYGAPDNVRSFLRGLYSANGSICGKRVTLKTTSKRLVEQVQEMLSSVGIRSYYTTNKPTVVEHRNGKYESRKSFDLNISTDRDIFCESIGFIQDYKMDKLKSIIENTKAKKRRKSHEIRKVEYVGDYKVYDITVSGESHTYWTHGFNSSNCGEVPLPPYDSCRLTAMNLFEFVKHPFTEDAYFDFNEFSEVVYDAQRIMDDVVDLEIEQVNNIIDKIENDPESESIKRNELDLWKKIRVKAKKGRRTGLGLTALGDTLAALGIRYGSDESIEFAEKVAKEQKISAYHSSVQLAEERGSFDMYSAEAENSCPFIKRIQEEEPDLYNEMREKGRRNIAILSIAPTGTVSMMAQTTSGVENLFEPYYIRSRKVNANDENVDVAYYDQVGNAWEEFRVFHKRFEQWLEVQGYDPQEVRENYSEDEIDALVADSPYDGATVDDVDWVNKVRMQGAMQDHIDHSISVTTNLPEDIDVETTKEVYEVAFKQGCKGQTIYRQNSRAGVLKKEKHSDGIPISEAPSRPEELECAIHRVRYNGDSWKIFVGFMDGDPYEVFARTASTPQLVNSGGEAIDSGKIRKVGSGEYQLIAPDGKVVIENIAENMPDDQVREETRLVSTALRHGTPLEFLVKQLDKAEGSIASFGRAMSKALKEHVDNVEVTCDECGSSNVRMKEGCMTCANCGSSKCG